MQLKPYQEIVGLLTDIKSEGGCNTAIFSMMMELDLPLDAINVVELKNFIGKRIGLLNNDGKIKVRKVMKQKGKMR